MDKFRLDEHRGYVNNSKGSHYTLPAQSLADLQITRTRTMRAYKKEREEY